jgi:hypothetical protein
MWNFVRCVDDNDNAHLSGAVGWSNSFFSGTMLDGALVGSCRGGSSLLVMMLQVQIRAVKGIAQAKQALFVVLGVYNGNDEGCIVKEVFMSHKMGLRFFSLYLVRSSNITIICLQCYYLCRFHPPLVTSHLFQFILSREMCNTSSTRRLVESTPEYYHHQKAEDTTIRQSKPGQTAGENDTVGLFLVRPWSRVY